MFWKKSKPLVIGICGRSCSGKSTVVRHLEEYFRGDYLHIEQDKFFKKQASNWEAPEAIRFDRLIYSIDKLKRGESTHISTHRWTEVFDRLVQPKKVIIVEGYLLFVDKKLSDLFDLKIFIDISDINMLYRRLKRDGNINGIDYTMNVVIPESYKYYKIQVSRADYVIDGNKSKEEVLEELQRIIKKRLSK